MPRPVLKNFLHILLFGFDFFCFFAMPAEEPQVAVHAAAIKLPQFWSENPDLWFFQAEAQFELRSISVSRTKYFYLVAALSPEAAGRVTSLLEEIPTEDPYEVLKSALCHAYKLTEYQRAEALANLPPLGDNRPSELLAKIRRLLPVGHKVCFRARYDFLSRLPSEIRATLVNSSLELDELAVQADNLWSAFQSNSQVFSTIQDPPVVDIPVDVVSRRSNQQGRRQNSARSAGVPNLCYYHRNFGVRARDCKATESGSPCEWVSPGNARAGRRN